MRYKIAPLFTFVLLAVSVSAQTHTPVLHTSDTLLTVQEGDFIYRKAWRISPELKPDVLVAYPFKGEKEIVFYSDCDTLFLYVKPEKIYDFSVVLNKRDTAWTRVDTRSGQIPTFTQPLSYTSPNPHSADTLHFRIGRDHGIHFRGTINGSDTLDFLFDTNAGANVITAAAAQKIGIHTQGKQLNGGADGVIDVPVSIDNTLCIGQLTWTHAPLLVIDYAGTSFDAILGWVAFENKILEIDYEKQRLIVHPSLPALDSSYSTLEIKMVNGIPYVECSLIFGGQTHTTWFGFDTGSDGTLFISELFSTQSGLKNAGLTATGKAVSTGSSGKPYTQTVLQLPEIRIGDYRLYQIPALVNDRDPEGTSDNELIGNLLLKRFNTFIDFQKGFIYLKPNLLWHEPMR